MAGSRISLVEVQRQRYDGGVQIEPFVDGNICKAPRAWSTFSYMRKKAFRISQPPFVPVRKKHVVRDVSDVTVRNTLRTFTIAAKELVHFIDCVHSNKNATETYKNSTALHEAGHERST